MGICIPSRDRLPPFQGRAGERLQKNREILRFLGAKVVKKQSSDKKVRRLRNIFRTFRTIFRTFRTPFRPSSALIGIFLTFTRNPSFKDENDLTRAQNPE